MKKIAGILSGVVCLLFAFSAKAENPFYAPYLGFEVMQTNMHCKDFYGKNIFAKNPLQFDFFAGIKWHENFGIEAGFGFQKRKRNTSTIYRGGSVAGELQNRSDEATYRTHIKSKHMYAGIFAECDFFNVKNTKVKALVGISPTTVYGAQDIISDAMGPYTPAEIEEEARTYRAKENVYMAKLSVIHYVTDNLGLSLSATWKDTSKFEIKNREMPNTDNEEIRLRDMYALGLGFIYSFI